jgi:hypothetical protein
MAASLSAPALASDISIFGLELSKPFTLKECGFKKVTKALNFYDATTDTICYKRMSNDEAGKGINLADDTVYIVWPRGNEPQIATYNTLLACVIDGNLESVGFNTLGLVSQERDMKALTDKFGPPTTGGTPIVQNGYGAKAQTIRAEWKMDDVVVWFNSAASSFDAGLVRIQTAKAIAAPEIAVKKYEANRQKL